MNVRVEVHGVLGRNQTGPPPGFDLAMQDGDTAEDLLVVLAERWGAPFRDAIASSDARLPRHIRMFAGGEMLSNLGQPLADGSEQNASVTVVLLSPMMGG